MILIGGRTFFLDCGSLGLWDQPPERPWRPSLMCPSLIHQIQGLSHPVQMHPFLAADGSPSRTPECLKPAWWPCGLGGWEEAEAWVCPEQNHSLPPYCTPLRQLGCEASQGGPWWESGAPPWGGRGSGGLSGGKLSFLDKLASLGKNCSQA